MNLLYVALTVGLPVFIAIILTVWVLSLRRVVNTNEVHITQSYNATTSFGRGMKDGNKYYQFPSWIPVIGIKVTQFPVSIFTRNLNNYEAYDIARLPFIIDITGFFRIEDPNTAAQRVSSMSELELQLDAILQSAARTILASKSLEEILQGRAEFGQLLTDEVAEDLVPFGVKLSKNIEFMDIRDAKESKVIRSIMEKRKSFIDMESRKEVAINGQLAQNAEIEAQREVDLNKQVALQQVGIRTAEKEREVGIALQKAQQEIKAQEKVTTEKQMEVVKVQQVKTAEITKEVTIVTAEQDKQKAIIDAEGVKNSTVTTAEGILEAKKLESEGIRVEGIARGEAEQAVLMAPINTQITLAKEIGENQGYQQYLITIRQVEAQETVGIKQAEAVGQSKAQIIVNSGDVSSGINKLGDIFSSKGGAGIGNIIEGLANTNAGKAIINNLVAKE